MILTELKDYISQHHGASRTELAQRFALSEDGVDAMLHVWLQKGAISRLEDKTPGSKGRVRVRYRVNSSDSLAINVTM
ncbi:MULTISPECIES: FeoC-like transcriptional regulator [Vibrio]|uniref:Iron transporter FeoC n=2 Tax=Vibrio TaxID=662 RepID=A0A7X4LHS2_9VIBR|nr:MULTISPECIES: FeoC-like transcriptional regulator [Vibrio]MBF8999539.1 iron transporter FeoC [Vibrio nitrifigilis]MZI92111.1 iron transporter FeoC [Vibrio eleionomae]